MVKKQHADRMIREYISELIRTNNLMVKDGVVTKNGNNIVIEKDDTCFTVILPLI